MAAIGSLVFCTDCGNLLDGSAGKQNVVLTCTVCGANNKDTSSKTVVTVSKPTAFPSALRAKRSEVQTLSEDDVNTTSVIAQRCEECGREEVRYYTQQLRSADEGSTVFYECDCGHKYVSIIHVVSETDANATVQMEHQQLMEYSFFL
jgi:DNA-directed RNA polymerase I subunit RPA12